MVTTRRHVLRALGILWIADSALQLQPFMFTTGFALEILRPAADGQPGWVAGPVRFFSGHITQHPALLNLAFALIQLAIGVGLLATRTMRVAILACIAWSLGVWWFGEGLAGLASGRATLITGAPGAVALYGVLAAAAWPARIAADGEDGSRRPVAGWLSLAWALIWVGGAVLQLLPGQNRASDVAASITGGAGGAPSWLAATDRSAARLVLHVGTSGVVTLAVLMAAIGLCALIPGRVRTGAAIGGGILALGFWAVGQDLGELYSGRSTDPNSGPLLLLFAAAVASCAATSREATAPLLARQAVSGSRRIQPAAVR